MSATYWLQLDVGGPEPVIFWDCNITYNLGKMLRAAGFPAWEALRGAPASETGGMLAKVADTLEGNPDHFKTFNPPNGWGDYDGCVRWVQDFADACASYPRATIGASL